MATKLTIEQTTSGGGMRAEFKLQLDGNTVASLEVHRKELCKRGYEFDNLTRFVEFIIDKYLELTMLED